VLEIVHDVAGFSYGRAELVRKALGKKNARRAVQAFHAEFVAGASPTALIRPLLKISGR